MPGTKPRHIAARQGYEGYVWTAPVKDDYVVIFDRQSTGADIEAFGHAWVACTNDTERDALLVQYRAAVHPRMRRQGTYVGS